MKVPLASAASLGFMGFLLRLRDVEAIFLFGGLGFQSFLKEFL